jgi:hypothetical protein
MHACMYEEPSTLAKHARTHTHTLEPEYVCECLHVHVRRSARIQPCVSYNCVLASKFGDTKQRRMAFHCLVCFNRPSVRVMYVYAREHVRRLETAMNDVSWFVFVFLFACTILHTQINFGSYIHIHSDMSIEGHLYHTPLII